MFNNLKEAHNTKPSGNASIHQFSGFPELSFSVGLYPWETLRQDSHRGQQEKQKVTKKQKMD